MAYRAYGAYVFVTAKSSVILVLPGSTWDQEANQKEVWVPTAKARELWIIQHFWEQRIW